MTKSFACIIWLASCATAFAQAAIPIKHTETIALLQACKRYAGLKEAKTEFAKYGVEDAVALGYCKGYFRGFMYASSEVFSQPDEQGKVTRFHIKDGTTFDQAIRVFLIALKEEPNLISEDAGTIIMATLQIAGLATSEVLPSEYTKRP